MSLFFNIKKQKTQSNHLIFNLISLILVFVANTAIAQSPIFSQYYASALYLNPALAGLQPEISLSANHRIQWQQVNPFTSSQLSLIYPFLNKNNPIHEHWGGVGLSAYHDQAGSENIIKQTGINANFAYNINLGNKNTNIITLGLQGGIIQQQINSSDFKWASHYTQGINQIDLDAKIENLGRKTVPSFATGAFWYFSNNNSDKEYKFKAYAGIAAFQINQPNAALLQGQSLRMPILTKVHLGLGIPIASKILASPNALIVVQNSFFQANTGVNLSYLISDNSDGLMAKPELILGTWYRWNDALIFNIGFATSKFALGFSFDMNNSYLERVTKGRGAYEISLSIKTPRGIQNKKFATPRI